MDERKEPLRRLLLKAHPEWHGHIRIHRDYVRVDGVGTVHWRNPDLPIEDEAHGFIELLEDLIERREEQDD